MKVIHLLRKPCSEGTVAANVLRWGTGALNIDATRISATDAFGGGAKATSGFVNGYAADGWVPGSPLGRWPANLVLQHLPECVQEGVKKVKAMEATGSRYAGTEGPANIDPGDAPLARRAWVSDDGTETIPAWTCAPGCPVAGLDAQSGTTKAVMRKPTGKPIYATEGTAMVWNSNSVTDTTERGFTDEGGASRFFKQVKP